MSSKNNHILDEIRPLLRESKNLSSVLEYIDTLSIYKPKITIDRTFQKNLRTKILTRKNEKKNSYFASHSFFVFLKVFSVAAACFVLTLWYFDIFFPKPISPEIQYIQKKTDIIPPQDIPEISPEKIPTKNIQELKKEKEAIDSEMSSIIDDINSISISPTSPQELDTTAVPATAKMQASPYSADVIDTTSTYSPISGRMAPMMVAIPEIQIPEYSPSMNIYIKSGSWENAEIVTQSGSGIIIRNMPTEKLSILRKKVDSILAGKEISWAPTIIYQIRKKIIIEPGNPSYLIPVIEYPTLWWEKISIPLIRGFR